MAMIEAEPSPDVSLEQDANQKTTISMTDWKGDSEDDEESQLDARPDGRVTKNHVSMWWLLGQAFKPNRKERYDSGWVQTRQVSIVLAAILLPFLLGTNAQSFSTTSSACLPGGTFIVPGSFSIWDIRYTLSITAGYGSFDFTTAKIIDLCWDLVIGRGAQALLAWVAYRVFNRAILCAMKSAEVSCDTYTAVNFHTGSLLGTWTVFWDFICGRCPTTSYGITIYLTMISTGLYILALPTLLSAMTSYGAVSTPLVSHGNVTLQFEVFQPCRLTIVRDGSRVGLTDGYVITDDPDKWDENDSALSEYHAKHSDLYRPWDEKVHNQSTGFCLDDQPSNSSFLLAASSIYVENATMELDAPLLNIINFTEANLMSTCWCHEDTIVSSTDLLRESASCGPTFKYQWGFSYLLLFATAVINAAIAITLPALDTWTHTKIYRIKGDELKPSTWRGIVNLAGAVHIAADGNEEDLTKKELEKRMQGHVMRVPSRELVVFKKLSQQDSRRSNNET